MKYILFLIIPLSISTFEVKAQIDQEAPGAWYMYFFNGSLKEKPWGVQGDIQYRNWNIMGDLEQLLLRGGITYKPVKGKVKFTLGYGHISTGKYGSDPTVSFESRVYQEALYPVKFGNRIYTNHRFRYEQRFVDGQNFRTRYRYNFFLNVALNKKEMEKGTLYLALYNELFVNGQRNIGDDKQVELFDRNRFYSGLGFVVSKGLKVQLAYMNQSTDNWRKNQFQVSLHQKF